MQEILTALAPYITPGAVKGFLALVALIGITVGLIRQKRGGLVTFLLALAVWVALDLISCKEPIWNVWPIAVRLGVFLLITVFTILLWKFRPMGYVNAGLCLLAAAAESVLYLVPLVRGMWMLGTLYATLEAVYAIVCGFMFVWCAVYSIRLALVKNYEIEFYTAFSSPLPADITLEDILPASAEEPDAFSVAEEIHNEEVAPVEKTENLPNTLLQTGIGAEILRAKRQLDAGEISAEEFKERKAALMGQEQ